jgi:hypothetical protein
MASKEICDLNFEPPNRYYIRQKTIPFGWEVYVDLKSRQFVLERIVTGAAIRMFSIDNRYGCNLIGGKDIPNAVYNFIEENGSWFLIKKRTYTYDASANSNYEDVKILILTPFDARVVKQLLKRKQHD